MSIEQTKVIDVTGVDKCGNIILTISDHLPWDSGEDHLSLLQEKVNSYLSFIESGQVLEEYPNANNSKIIIDVVGKYELNSEARGFYECASEIINDAGFELRFSLFVKD